MELKSNPVKIFSKMFTFHNFFFRTKSFIWTIVRADINSMFRFTEFTISSTQRENAQKSNWTNLYWSEVVIHNSDINLSMRVFLEFQNAILWWFFSRIYHYLTNIYIKEKICMLFIGPTKKSHIPTLRHFDTNRFKQNRILG